jgi:riboflavin kinase/FMN adenylyltransferase
MTFEPHPREYFAQRSGDLSKAPARIANLRDKLESLSDAGVDRVIVEHFNEHFASMSPQEFTEARAGRRPAREMADGRRRFLLRRPARRQCRPAAEAGKEYGFEVHSLPAVLHAATRISSSAVRAALAAGDFDATRALLGHPIRCPAT